MHSRRSFLTLFGLAPLVPYLYDAPIAKATPLDLPGKFDFPGPRLVENIDDITLAEKQQLLNTGVVEGVVRDMDWCDNVEDRHTAGLRRLINTEGSVIGWTQLFLSNYWAK